MQNRTPSLNNLSQDTAQLILQYIDIAEWIKLKIISRQWYQFIFHAIDRIQLPRDYDFIFGKQSHLPPFPDSFPLSLLMYFKVKKIFANDHLFLKKVIDLFNFPEYLANLCSRHPALSYLVMESPMKSKLFTSLFAYRPSSFVVRPLQGTMGLILSRRYLDIAIKKGWVQELCATSTVIDEMQSVILGTAGALLFAYLLDCAWNRMVHLYDQYVTLAAPVSHDAAKYRKEHPGVTTDNFLKGKNTHAFFPPAPVRQAQDHSSNEQNTKRRRLGARFCGTNQDC